MRISLLLVGFVLPVSSAWAINLFTGYCHSPLNSNLPLDSFPLGSFPLDNFPLNSHLHLVSSCNSQVTHVTAFKQTEWINAQPVSLYVQASAAKFDEDCIECSEVD